MIFDGAKFEAGASNFTLNGTQHGIDGGRTDDLALWSTRHAGSDRAGSPLASEAAFDRGEIDLLWLCGLPYTWKADDPVRSIRLMVAPVMATNRYQREPIYFSDVIVRQPSSYQSFSDLQGAPWALNELNSHSGFNLTRWHLSKLGFDWRCVRSVEAASSHEAALGKVLEGRWRRQQLIAPGWNTR